jgi:hypothetical protein
MQSLKDLISNLKDLLNLAIIPAGVGAIFLWGMCHYAPYSAMGKWLVLQIFLQ